MTSAGPTAERDDAQLERAVDVAGRLLANIEVAVRGKTDEIKLVLVAFACKGHVLFEDVPGTAKTVLARAIALSVEGAEPSRIQCTPDLQPTDLTGLSVWNQQARDFEFRPGPIFANIVLVDEINRAMPKTQSALLEAMAERQVTIDGVTSELSEPFVVLATQNPIELEDTFPLPEAQLDRFFLKTSLGYPGADDELQIVRDQRHGHPLGGLGPVVQVAEVMELQDATEDVYMDELLQRWIIDLVRATRDLDIVAIGSSVRGSLALERAARGWALLERAGLRPAGGHRVAVPAGARAPDPLHPVLPRRGAEGRADAGARALPGPLPRRRSAPAGGPRRGRRGRAVR